ncbi:MAG: hypothetical protein IJX52_03750 [Oscillibacter sp.]|nr:hypothetical protein [Oscillibacter sp.]
MEKKLARLLDYQKFHPNRRLAAIIADVEDRYENALSDEDLSLVSAAGEAWLRPGSGEEAP